MLQYSVNLSTIFTEVPFLERFKRAKKQGFKYIECQFPYGESVEDIKKQLDLYDLSLILINLFPGDWIAGDRGLSIYPNRTDEFRQSVDLGIHYANQLGVKTIHCMAGILPDELLRDLARKTYIENITYAAEKMSEYNIKLVIEPINGYDMPGYFLSNIEEAIQIIEDVGLPNVGLQFDFYHIQKIQGNLISTFEKYKDYIQHVQIADNPGRHEPGTGEINYKNIFSYLNEVKYKGKIGLEYIPKNKSEDSFSWVKNRGRSR